MKRKAKNLYFISWIKRDGSGTIEVPENLLECMLNNSTCKNEKFKLNSLSVTEKTYIASGFNSFVVRLKTTP